MKKPLSDRIFNGWYYAVGMFPAWLTEKSPRKWVRFVGVLFAIPWFALFLPVTFLVSLFMLPLMIWEDA